MHAVYAYNSNMSVIEDVRKVFQDLVAPELKSLNTRVDGLEKTVDAKLETMSVRVSSLEREMDHRLKALEERAAARHELILSRLETFAAKVDARFDVMAAKAEADRAEVLRAIDTDKRLSSLEAMSMSPGTKARLGSPQLQTEGK